MKRRRKSRVKDTNSKRGRNKNVNGNFKGNHNHNHLQIHYSGSSFSDLPKDIMLNILFRLVIKSILACKAVCKTWHDLISDPEFAKLHFDKNRDRPSPLIHTWDEKSILSEMLYLADKDDFELSDHTFCSVKVEFDTKFDLPSRDQIIASGHTVRSPYCQSNKEQYRILNSCNGLLCLCIETRNDSLIICNPVTAEFGFWKYVDGCMNGITYGFGFSQVSKRYKVVKLIDHGDGLGEPIVTTEVLTVGTKSWRKIDSKPEYIIYDCPIYLNGFLYWSSCSIPLSIVSFDIESECFGLELGPKMDKPYNWYADSVGVLGGELCISVNWNFGGTLYVWALKKSGVEKVWSKVISTDINSFGKRMRNTFTPMKYLNDGSLLMLYDCAYPLLHVDLRKGRIRFLDIYRMESEVKQIVAHVPSLVSLKHSLSGHNVKVLSFRSR